MSEHHFEPAPLTDSAFSRVMASIIPPFKRVRAGYAELCTQYRELADRETTLHQKQMQLEERHSILKDDHQALEIAKNTLDQKQVQLEEHHSILKDDHQALEIAKNTLDQKQVQLEERHSILKDDHQALRIAKDTLDQKQVQLEERHSILKDDHQALDITKGTLDQKLAQLEEHHSILKDDHQALEIAKNKLDQKQVQLEERHSILKDDHQALEIAKNTLDQKQVQLEERHSILKDDHQALEIARDTLDQEVTGLKEALSATQHQKESLSAQLDEVQKSLHLAHQNEAAAVTLNNQTEFKLADLQGRYHLISSAISAQKVDSPRYLQFSKIITEQFLPFANTVRVLANEAEVVIRLKAVEDQVRLVESLSRFKNKTVVAVSGGFSSGKSSFITSLFSHNDIKLPIGVQPVTAIPTYVFHACDSRIVGYSANGGEVDISAEIYAQLSHEYVKEFGFNLRDLLPFIALETPIEHYNNLSFIDLPGYNPGEREGFTGQDELSAAEFMTQAQCILWVIGLDANGTISRADIDFLRDHVPQDTRLYIILNKADLKPPADLQDIILVVAEMLDMDGIIYEGISAYSSEDRKELDFQHKSLHDILVEWNQPKDTYKSLLEEINHIFQSYNDAFSADIESCKSKAALLKALELDLFEMGVFEEKISAEQAFDFKDYRKKTKGSGIGMFGSIARMYGMGGMMDEESSTIPEENNEEVGQRNKIATVKKHIHELRTAYDTKERKAQAEVLNTIHQKLVEVLT